MFLLGTLIVCVPPSNLSISNQMFFVSCIMYSQASEVKSYRICSALKKKNKEEEKEACSSFAD